MPKRRRSSRSGKVPSEDTGADQAPRSLLKTEEDAIAPQFSGAASEMRSFAESEGSFSLQPQNRSSPMSLGAQGSFRLAGSPSIVHGEGLPLARRIVAAEALNAQKVTPDSRQTLPLPAMSPLASTSTRRGLSTPLSSMSASPSKRRRGASPAATTPVTMASPTGSTPTSLVYRQGLGMSPILFGSPQSDVPRYDSSLGSLTKKFISILMTSPEQGIDLSEAANEMGVAKRRLYDVTNVLEGVGVIVKHGKNRSMLNPDPHGLLSDKPAATSGAGAVDDSDGDQIGSPPRLTKTTGVVPDLARTKGLHQEIVAMRQEERHLDEYIDVLVAMAKDFAPPERDPKDSEAGQALSPSKEDNFSNYMYVTYGDLLSLGSYGSDTVIAARAPSGTTVEVPDPDQGMRPGARQFKLYLDSQGGQQDCKGDIQPIEVFLVQYLGADLSQSANAASVAASTTTALSSESTLQVPPPSEARASYPHDSRPSGEDVRKKPYIYYDPRLSSPYADAQLSTDEAQRQPYFSTDTRSFATPGSAVATSYGASGSGLYENVPSQQPYPSNVYPSMGQPPLPPPHHLQAYPYAGPGSYDSTGWQHWQPTQESRPSPTDPSYPGMPWAPPVPIMPRKRGPPLSGASRETSHRSKSRSRAAAASTKPPTASARRKRASPGASLGQESARKARKPRSLLLKPRTDSERPREPAGGSMSPALGGLNERDVKASAMQSGAAYSPLMRGRDIPRHDDAISMDTGDPLTPRALSANLAASSGMSPMNFHFDLLDMPLQSPSGRSYGATPRQIPGLGSPMFPSSTHQGPWHSLQPAPPYPLPGLPNDLSPDDIFPGNGDDSRWALLPQGSSSIFHTDQDQQGGDDRADDKERDGR